MARRFTACVIAANDLLGGHPVWLARDDRWVTDFRDAELIEERARAEARLRLAASREQEVVGPYMAAAMRGPDGRPRPLHLRETLRAAGPSVPRNPV